MKRNLILMAVVVASALIMTACADSKTFVIDGKEVTVEPYGWANKDTRYNDKVIYEANVGNIVWDIILFETVVVPVWLTGWQLYEPVRLKESEQPNSQQQSENN